MPRPASPATRPRVAIIGLALLALACADRPGPTGPVGPPRAERSSGAEVVNDPGHFFTGFGGGPPTNLVVLTGLADPLTAAAELCAGRSVLFAPGGSFWVTTPTGRVLVRNETVESPVAIFRYDAGPITDACQIVGAPVVATGTATFAWRISNLTDEAPGATAFHASVIGIVELTSGGQARLFAEARAVVRPDGTLVIEREVVRLTPL